MKVGEIRKDYLKLTYAKGETLYILPENLDSLQKYVGPGERDPKLSRLGGDEWKRSVSRAREAIKKVAYDLLKIYAARSVNKGFACAPDEEQQKLFEDKFPFVETDDQLRATHEIKADLESERPMDRLLCGDVGFGKTEVAFRAMFKAVMNGRQVIMLAPTTRSARTAVSDLTRTSDLSPGSTITLRSAHTLRSRALTSVNIREPVTLHTSVTPRSDAMLTSDAVPSHVTSTARTRSAVLSKTTYSSEATPISYLPLSWARTATSQQAPRSHLTFLLCLLVSADPSSSIRITGLQTRAV